ncbi:flavodoxin [Vibrio brasiliensis]
MTLPKIAEIKNQWLYQQVDVEFPTKESVAGMELYKDAVSVRQYQTLSEIPVADSQMAPEDIFLVDFHRLTVMFALLQAGRWSNESDQQLIVEFLTQIIYSEPCSLYLCFKEGEAVAAAIITIDQQTVLISDVVLKSSETEVTEEGFLAALYTKLDLPLDDSHTFIIEQ